jgi:hypothetical protein
VILGDRVQHLTEFAVSCRDRQIESSRDVPTVVSIRYHGVFAPNHKLRRAVTALAIGNVGTRGEAGAGQHAGKAHATGCCDANQKPRSHDTSRIAWAKLMARLREEFPLECPACGGDIRLIAFRLLSECETIPGLRTLGNLRLLRTSCPRTGADPEDSHPLG